MYILWLGEEKHKSLELAHNLKTLCMMWPFLGKFVSI